MAFYIGALVGTFIINKLFLWIVRKLIGKKISRQEAAVLSFVLSVIFVFIAHKPHSVVDSTFKYIYVPCLIWWLIFELFINKKSEKKNENDEIQTRED